jgi:tetratricopeptide (TPR) repeat protein
MLCFTSGSEQSTIRSRAFALLKNQKKLATAHQSIEAFPEYGQSLFNRADKSIDIAQATKDVPLFEEAISMYLELNPHSSASISLKRQKALRQMDFYKDLGLIDKLAKATISFCEDSLMRLKEENIMLLAASCVSRGSIIDETLPYDQKVNVCRQYIIGNMASDLNRGAWGFYERIINKTLLNQAIGWSRRSLTLTEEANYLDTLAHLLYKVGQVDEAMLYESKAVEVAKQKGEDSLAFQNVLNQMKGKTLR